MTRGEFIEQTKGMSDDAELVLSVDGEGNEIKIVDTIELNLFNPVTAYYGDLVTEEEAGPDTKEAIVLWPLN